MSKFDVILTKLRRTNRIRNLYALALIKRYQYWDKFLSFLFKYSTRCYCRKGPLEIEKFRNQCKDLKYFSDHFGRFSTSKTLIGKVTKDQSDVDITCHLLDLVYRNIKNPRSCELVTAEILSKVLAYRNLQENTSIFIPTIDEEQNIHLVEYAVDTVFDLWKQHFAFGLYPKSSSFAHPILLFRGTDFSLLSEGGRASIISDLDPDGPGRRLYDNSRSGIRQWLSQIASTGKKARVMGHSLGGALALYTLIYESEHLSTDSFAPSYAFNPPGISEEAVAEYNQISKKNLPEFHTFVSRGDIISKFGILCGKAFEMFTNKPLSPVLAHEQLIFSQPVSYLAEIDNEKENAASSRKYYSGIQRQTTSFTFKFGLKYLFPNPY